MRTAAILMLVSGCAIYSGDDVEPGADAGLAVDAAPQPITTMYRARWECVTTGDCVSPLSGEDVASVRVLEGDAQITWFHDGAPAPVAVHAGTMTGDCIRVLAGSDAGLARSDYNACPVPGAPAAALEAAVSWGSSSWRVVLSPT